MKIGMKLAVAASVCALAAGCTGYKEPIPATVTDNSAPSTPSSTARRDLDPAAVAWLNGFCGAVHGYRLANNKRLEGAPREQVMTKGSSSKDLGEMAELAGKTVTELTALPPSPFKGGDKVKQDYLAKFTAARDAAAEGKRKVDAAKGDGWMDPGTKALDATQAAVSDTTNPLGSFETADPVFGAAAVKADKCSPSS
ncbi:hypothetical protein LWC34_47380 [Kibdelosporangium philippinense]|uniref:Lipoprotein n=1 Tax=Kibdelosporangium philippinense TaxID=211113 RepID=A0ABS8ZT10_9PSEU|nr:hypothetical protein [Kibdelosporangium philippinense]MCE7010378.1 hypothetical protein [Kibdelosporangium philippinense]